jgi:hypothetical protein
VNCLLFATLCICHAAFRFNRATRCTELNQDIKCRCAAKRKLNFVRNMNETPGRTPAISAIVSHEIFQIGGMLKRQFGRRLADLPVVLSVSGTKVRDVLVKRLGFPEGAATNFDRGGQMTLLDPAPKGGQADAVKGCNLAGRN